MSALAAALPLVLAAAHGIPDRDRNGLPHLRSESVVVRLADTGEIVLKKSPQTVRPIASVTKLLSAIVLSRRPAAADLPVTIEEQDKDRKKWSRSHLPVGVVAPWERLVEVALSASDNRAMSAVSRAVLPRAQFVDLMNRTARELGMKSSRFVDPAGIDPGNVSTALDLLALLEAAAGDARVRGWASQPFVEVPVRRGTLRFRNTDRLVHRGTWDVVVGKTGYTVEAGRALVTRVTLASRPVDLVLLGSREMQSVFGDAGRIRRWLLPKLAAPAASPAASPAAAPAR